MYEELDLRIILFSDDDIIRTSNEDSWSDENVDDGGWT